ncbi:MAG: hypothetical protein ACI4OJ_05100 [Lachnospiraceae bacterium]
MKTNMHAGKARSVSKYLMFASGIALIAGGILYLYNAVMDYKEDAD